MMKQAVFFSAYSWLELQHDLIKFGNMDRTQFLDQVSLTLKGRVNNTQNSHFLIRYIAENGCDWGGTSEAPYLIDKLAIASEDIVNKNL